METEKIKKKSLAILKEVVSDFCWSLGWPQGKSLPKIVIVLYVCMLFRQKYFNCSHFTVAEIEQKGMGDTWDAVL